MTVSLDLLSQMLSNPTDCNTLAFQDARRRFDRKKLFQYCAAIANEGGGSLVLGVTYNTPRKVVGTRAFPDLAKIEQEICAKLQFRVGVSEINHPDGRVVVFNIPSRPQGTAYTFEGAYLMCVGGKVVYPTTDWLRRLFAEDRPDFLGEPTKSNLDAQTIIDLLDIQAFFELLKLPYPSTREGVIDKLVAERLIDRSEGSFSIPRIGALLLAKRLSDFGELPDKAPRIIVYSGQDERGVRFDWTSKKGYAVGFQDLIDLVMTLMPNHTMIKNVVRESVKLVPEVAVKELIANALIHQDFVISGEGVKIEIYSNRVEISNPGTPMIEADRFISEYQTRNMQLSDALRLMKLCDESGLGIDKVIHAVENSHLPAPEFRVTNNRTRVVIYGDRNFKEMAKNECVRACFQHCVLRSESRQLMTNDTLRNRFGLPRSKRAVVSAVIEDAVNSRLIKMERYPDSLKNARYVPYWDKFI